MRLLYVFTIWPQPLTKAVAGALDKTDPMHGRETPQIRHRKHKWSVDQTMNQELMLLWVNIRHAAVMPFVV